MKLKTLLILAIMFSLAQLPIFTRPYVPAKIDVIEVPADFPTIQAAIANATDGDTIFVRENTYYENITVNKTLSIIGESKERTTIDGNGSGITVKILAENVSISSFTIRGSGSNVYDSGVFISGASCNITDNIITENGLFGICLNQSSNNLVSRNVIKKNKVDGIVLYDSSDNTFATNAISENRFSFHLYRSHNNIISDNVVTENSLGGISLIASNDNLLTRNKIPANAGTGIILDYSADNNTLTENNITSTQGFGLIIGSCSNNTLRGNNMTSNTYNFYCPATRPNLSDFSNDIDTSNTVDGLSIQYLVNKQGLLIEPSTFPNIGYLALVNCSDITVQNINFSRNGQGALIAFTNNTLIRRVDASLNNHGLQLLSSSNNTIMNNVFYNNTEDGLTLDYSTIRNTVANNTLMNNKNAVRIAHSTNENVIRRNSMTNNTNGLLIYSYNTENTFANNLLTNNTIAISMARLCDNNTLTQNTIADNSEGLVLSVCSNNTIYQNNFLNNTVHTRFIDSTNVWDSGSVIGGNYWSNYTGTDLNYDGIGDSHHTLDENNTDKYPLMGIFRNFETITETNETHNIQVISNSTVNDFCVLQWLSSPNQYLQTGQRYIHFSATGSDNTRGFCRVTIPREILNGTYAVLMDWQEIPFTVLEMSNATHAQLYFSYQHSTHEIVIVPEMTSTIFALILAAVTILVAGVRTEFYQHLGHRTSSRRFRPTTELDRSH